jgi:hypothetical protein
MYWWSTLLDDTMGLVERAQQQHGSQELQPPPVGWCAAATGGGI